MGHDRHIIKNKEHNRQKRLKMERLIAISLNIYYKLFDNQGLSVETASSWVLKHNECNLIWKCMVFVLQHRKEGEKHHDLKRLKER